MSGPPLRGRGVVTRTTSEDCFLRSSGSTQSSSFGHGSVPSLPPMCSAPAHPTPDSSCEWWAHSQEPTLGLVPDGGPWLPPVRVSHPLSLLSWSLCEPSLVCPSGEGSAPHLRPPRRPYLSCPQSHTNLSTIIRQWFSEIPSPVSYL